MGSSCAFAVCPCPCASMSDDCSVHKNASGPLSAPFLFCVSLCIISLPFLFSSHTLSPLNTFLPLLPPSCRFCVLGSKGDPYRVTLTDAKHKCQCIDHKIRYEWIRCGSIASMAPGYGSKGPADSSKEIPIPRTRIGPLSGLSPVKVTPRWSSHPNPTWSSHPHCCPQETRLQAHQTHPAEARHCWRYGSGGMEAGEADRTMGLTEDSGTTSPPGKYLQFCGHCFCLSRSDNCIWIVRL